MLATALLFVQLAGDRHSFVLDGYEIVFHGFNAVKKEPPYIPKTDSFEALESLSDRDIADLRADGFNLLRFGVMQPGVFLLSGAINETYLQQVRLLVDKLGQNGIFTVLDFHQDLLTPAACGEGFGPDLTPPVAGRTQFPSPMKQFAFLENSSHSFENKMSHEMKLLRHSMRIYDKPPNHFCRQRNFGVYYLTFYINSLFGHLYSGAPLHGINLTEKFALFWHYIALHFKDSQFVVGYDLLNEPFPSFRRGSPLWLAYSTFERKVLQPFYNGAIAEIRKADTAHIIFLEPSSVNFGRSGLKLGHMQQLSFHIYCYFLKRSGDVISSTACNLMYDAVYRARSKMAAALGSVAFVGEFGASANSKAGLAALAHYLELFQGASWCYWQLKDFGDITTCFPRTPTDNEGLYAENGRIFEYKAKLLSHPYLQSFSGRILRQKFDFKGQKLLLNVTQGSGMITQPRRWAYVALDVSSGCEANYQSGALQVRGADPCLIKLFYE